MIWGGLVFTVVFSTREKNMKDDNKKYGDSDDDRYYYSHYEDKDYYSENDGFGRARFKIDLVIFIVFAIFLILLEFMD